jgi:outer membrane lipoprotein-sorting protein
VISIFTVAVLLVALAPASSQPAAAKEPSARQIMEEVSQTRKLAGSEAVVKMTIANESGKTRERTIAMATKLYDGGKTEKRIYRFESPADVKGTGVLVFDYEAEADDVWVYLPALRKTRRIVSAQRSQSFMGSEFSYADLNVPALDDYDYKLLGEESFGGEPCFTVELRPKSKDIAQSEGYSKKLYWVSKAKHVVRKGIFYDLDGKVLKELTCDDVKLLDEKNQRYRPMRMQMVN